MKKLILTLGFLSFAFSLFANIEGNGYYRVKNYGSQRWCTLIDNQGEVNIHAVQANLHALKLTNDTQEILSDPGSIIYLNNISGYEYNISGQGLSLQSLVDVPIKIMKDGTANGQNLYRMFGTKNSVSAYIGDDEYHNNEEIGHATILRDPNGTYANYTKWEILPVNVTTDNYFGTYPTVTANSGNYTTLYTSFAYQPYSSGMKAYYIGKVGWGIVEMVEITGAVPQNSPVIIQCAGSSVANNKLELKGNQAALPSNGLSGVFFNYDNPNDKYYHNYVRYDAKTMRVLGRCSDGSLGFIVDQSLIGKNIPANTVYLTVHPSGPAEYKCLSPSDYVAGVDTIGVESVKLSYDGKTIYSGAEINVFDMAGRLVAQAAESLDVTNLPKGVYVAVSNGDSLKIMR